MELFKRILKTAVDGEASDVHVKIGGPVIFRIHGDLVAVEAPIPTEEWLNKIVDEIVPAHAKKRLEENREADFSYFIPDTGRFRTNVFQQRGQFCIAMRYVKTQVPAFEELGLLEVLRDISRSPRGIVLVTGSTGSGKSTTLAAMIEYINANFKRHIITLEDPIEFVFEDNQSVVEQREIGLDTLSFQAGLKHILRQDPDVIMIGELRDVVSISAAMSSADTGHLVLATLHTTNAPQAIGRILDFFPANDRDQARRQLAATLQAVVCQRLVGTVDGGVTPAIEVMINTPTVRKLIEESRFEKLGAAIETGTDEGMINFNQHLYALVQEGRVTQEEALASASNPQALEMNFKGIFLDESRRILS
ncbi:MAG: type IV pilus twitching motility protein PilT [Limisphaerales bacterium]|jgi:twitching motility protein PilT|nr:PilT/PilU family type 4a pilus ATPase [Verrucomicrobiota bacterium]